MTPTVGLAAQVQTNFLKILAFTIKAKPYLIRQLSTARGRPIICIADYAEFIEILLPQFLIHFMEFVRGW